MYFIFISGDFRGTGVHGRRGVATPLANKQKTKKAEYKRVKAKRNETINKIDKKNMPVPAWNGQFQSRPELRAPEIESRNEINPINAPAPGYYRVGLLETPIGFLKGFDRVFFFGTGGSGLYRVLLGFPFFD